MLAVTAEMKLVASLKFLRSLSWASSLSPPPPSPLGAPVLLCAMMLRNAFPCPLWGPMEALLEARTAEREGFPHLAMKELHRRARVVLGAFVGYSEGDPFIDVWG